MSALRSLLRQLETRGVKLKLEGDDLRVRAPKGALTPEMTQQLKAHKQALITFLEQRRDGVSARIPRLPRDGELPLSPAQQRLWFLERMQEGDSTYNIPAALELDGHLDVESLRRAIDDVIRRHEILRSFFEEQDGSPVQRIAPVTPFPLEVEDLGGDEASAAEEARSLASLEAATAFDLETGPLFRVRLLRLTPRRHVLLVTQHHIISDGWSIGILVRELSLLYSAFVQGEPSPLPPLSIQYVDFAAWQRHKLSGDGLQASIDYWRRQLDGSPSCLELPGDRPRPSTRSGRGGLVRFRCEAPLAAKAEALSRETGSTKFMLLLAAFACLLGRYSRSRDVLVGTPTANRSVAETEPLMGLFVNTVVLRNDLTPSALTFRQHLQRTRAMVLAAFEHGELPFEEVVQAAQVPRDTSHSPLFQVMFTFTGDDGDDLTLPDLKVTSFDGERDSAKFDLTLVMGEDAGGFYGTMEFSRDLFEHTTVEALVTHFQVLLGHLLASPDRPLAGLPLMSAEERAKTLAGWPIDIAAVDLPAHPETVPQQLIRQAKAQPNALAVSSAHQNLTFAELVGRASHLAHRLRALGAGPEKAVGVCMERSVDWVVAKLAVMLSGSFYVPMDPNLPQERLAYVANDAALVLLLRDGKGPELTGIDSLELPTNDSLDPLPPPPPVDLLPDHAAYSVYTSGSTGQPKGVLVTHRQLCNLVAWHRRDGGLGWGQKSATTAGLAFDAVVLELWPYLASGVEVAIPSPERVLNAESLRDWIVDEELHHLFLPTPMAELMFDVSWPAETALRRMVIGGDKLHHYPRAGLPFDVINHYGPTEATVIATAGFLQPGKAGVPDIGRPIDNVELYILDEQLEPVPDGILGQLFLGGAALARGYNRRPVLTASAYVPDHLSGRPGARLYGTGDWVRRYNGRLEFHGRMDHQVKIRGIRIELGEIEAALMDLDGVREAVAQVCEDPSSGRNIYAWCTAEKGVDVTALQQGLAAKLPAYMVPRALQRVESMPLTPNGKIDRAALALDLPSIAGRGTRRPRTPVEEVLCSIFAEVLAMSSPGIDEDFFALGGHSLLATRVISRIETRLGVTVPLRVLFEAPTVAGLAQRLAGLTGRRTLPPIAPVAGTEGQGFPLSFAQQRLWFLDQLTQSAYLISVAARLDGPLNLQAMEATIALLVRRHASLRTVFASTSDEVVQVITDGSQIQLEVDDLRDRGERAEDVAARVMEEETTRTFDLTRGPLFRARLLVLEPQRHVLLISMHHIISDGWSMEVFFAELSRVYLAYSQGLPSPLADPVLQYADFAVWQRQHLEGGVLEEQLRYWKEQLAGARSLELPSDRPAPKVRSFRGAASPLAVPPDVTAGVLELSRSHGVTPFMTLLAVFQLLLARYCDRRDVVVSSPIANRNLGETESLIGFFVNTLALRAHIDEGEEFLQLLAQVRQTTLDAWAHQDLPFEKLVEALALARQPGQTPFLNVVYTLDSTRLTPKMPSELELSLMSPSSRSAKFDLSLSMRLQDDQLSGELVYSTDLFDARSIDAMGRCFLHLLGQVMEDPRRPMIELSLLDAGDRRELLEPVNCTAVDFGDPIPIHQQIETVARQRPTSIAIVHGPAQVTFDQLNRRANRLARRLRHLGARPGQPVAVCLGHSIALAVAQLAILKSGAPYLPLDPASPDRRLEVILEEAEPCLLVTEGASMDRFEHCGVPVVDVQDDLVQGVDGHEENLGLTVGPATMAYIVYTSGSTGKPKGVCVGHRPLTNLVNWFRRRHAVAPHHKASWTAGVAFDAAVWEIWSYLSAGTSLTIPPEDVRLVPQSLQEWLVAEEVTHAFAPTAITEQLVAMEWPDASNLHLLVTGGDQLKVYPNPDQPFVLVNAYGPTECTVITTAKEVEPCANPIKLPSLGSPIANLQIYVLDRHGRLQPEGVPGELHVGGTGVAMGYWKQGALTAAAFVPDPFSEEPGARLYRTGDLVRWSRWGLEFLGRNDHQIQLRGFRIEPGEIETVILRQAGVGEALVLPTPDGNHLVAYLVPALGQSVDVEALPGLLRGELPSYMVPRHWTVLEQMPLNVNGKVDRNALPEPQLQSTGLRKATTPTEQRLARLFEGLLGIAEPGIDDDFFDLGGHSLLAVRLLEDIAGEFGVDVPIASFFEGSSIAALAHLLDDGADLATSPLVALQPLGEGPPLFLVHPVDGTVRHLSAVARQLGPDQPVYGLQSPSLEAGAPVLTRYEEMATVLLAEMRKVQPVGPYYLGGYSLGGVLALEMAQQLQVRGETVDLLCLLDSHLPESTSQETQHLRVQMEQAALEDGDGVKGMPTVGQRLDEVYMANLEAHRHYRPRPYSGTTVLFAAQDADAAVRKSQWEAWTKWAPVRRVDVAGDHRSMMAKGHAATLAELIRRELAQAVRVTATVEAVQ